MHICVIKEDNEKDKGKLPEWIVEPEFMADLGHRKKSFAKKFYALSKLPVSKSRVNRTIAKRLNKLGLCGAVK